MSAGLESGCHNHIDLTLRRACSDSLLIELREMWHKYSPRQFREVMLSGGAGEKCAPILDQPLTVVADGHEEKVDRYHGENRPIWTVNIAHGKERVGDREIGFDEGDPVVGECRFC